MKLALIALAGTLLTGSVAVERHPWMRWEEGAWVERAIGRADGKSMTKREELISISEKGFTIGYQFTFDDIEGMEPIADEQTLGVGYMGFAHLDPDAENMGTESVEIGGRKYACTIWRAKGRFDQPGTTDTSWISGELAYPLRIHHANEQAEMLLELVSQRESIGIGRKRVTCVKYAGRLFGERDGEEIDQGIEWWHSLDVPGGMVRVTLTMTGADGKPEKHVTEVTGFGTKSKSR